MQKILAISGKKQSGKDTCFKFIKGLMPHAKHFYFADPLKRMCIDILGCPEDKVYGSDADKNEKVEHLLWENFPVPAYTLPDGSVFTGVPNGKFQTPSMEQETWTDGIALKSDVSKLITYEQPLRLDLPIYSGVSLSLPYKMHDGVAIRARQGPMSVREVLQYWGSDIFRRAYNDVWADACIRAIRKDGCEFAVITDCRFPNEVEVTKAEGGKVIRLTRNVRPEDKHISETALDPDVYDWSRFDHILYNSDINIPSQCLHILRYLMEIGWYSGHIGIREFLEYAEQAA